MNKLFGFAFLVGVSLTSSAAQAASVSINEISTHANIYLDEGTTGSAHIVVKNGYIAIYAGQHALNRTFSCNIWYTHPNFIHSKETLLAAMNTAAFSAQWQPLLEVTKDATGACSEIALQRNR